MGKKLYVGNLSYGVSSSDLQAMFSPHGTVESAEVINDRATGRSKGFGFVEMANDSDAQAAISALNGQEHEGRALTVNEARPREERAHATALLPREENSRLFALGCHRRPCPATARTRSSE